MATAVQTHGYAGVEKQAEKLIADAKSKAAKLRSSFLAKMDLRAKEKELIGGLLELYGIHRAATEQGVEVDFKPDWRTAALRHGTASAPRSGGKKGGKSETLLEAIKAAGKPLSVEELKAPTKLPEKNLRQMVYQLTKTGRLVSMRQEGNTFVPVAKGERGGFYGLPA